MAQPVTSADEWLDAPALRPSRDHARVAEDGVAEAAREGAVGRGTGWRRAWPGRPKRARTRKWNLNRLRW